MYDRSRKVSRLASGGNEVKAFTLQKQKRYVYYYVSYKLKTVPTKFMH